jgi:ATP-binding cassette, subfamily C, bacterial CydD
MQNSKLVNLGLGLLQLHPEILRLSRDSRGQIAGVVVVGFAITATYFGQALLVAGVLLNIFSGKSWESNLSSVTIVVALIIGRTALLWWRELLARTCAENIKERVRRRMYAHLLKLGAGYLEQNRTGTVQASLVDGVEKLEGYLGYYVPQVVVALVAPLVIVSYIYTLDWAVATLMLVCIPFIPIARNLWRKILGEKGTRHWGAYAEVNTEFLDSVQGMSTLKTFGAGERHGRTLENRVQKLYRDTMGQLLVSLFGNTIIGLTVSIGSALAVGVGALRLASGDLTAGQLLVILFLAGECFRPQTELNGYWHMGYFGVSAATGINRLLDAQPLVTEPAQPVRDITLNNRPLIAFENVTFGYNDGERLALDNLSFQIAPGEKVALVGRSGAGKSTVVGLLLRFFDPQNGQVRLGGRPLPDYALATLRSQIALVSQETYLFYGTVADNLRLGKPDATQAEMEAAARAAGAHAFIEALPDGYETVIGERGVRLSGGERQRLSIARALLKDAPILVLDEATASLDAANEALIQTALEKLMQGRTCLIIAHRLSTVATADRILVLDAGQVVESGAHGELLARQENYARLVAAQSPVGSH